MSNVENGMSGDLNYGWLCKYRSTEINEHALNSLIP